MFDLRASLERAPAVARQGPHTGDEQQLHHLHHDHHHHHHQHDHDNKPTFNPFLSPDGLPCPSVQLNELKVQTAVRFSSRNSKPYDFYVTLYWYIKSICWIWCDFFERHQKVCFRNNLNHSKAQNLSCESITTGCHSSNHYSTLCFRCSAGLLKVRPDNAPKNSKTLKIRRKRPQTRNRRKLKA